MSDSYRPITTSRQVSLPEGHRLYTTRRRVAAEYPVPLVGQTMATFLPGSPYTAHIITGVFDNPSSDGQLDVTIEHTAVPAGTTTEYEAYPYTFPPIYPKPAASTYTFFPGGSEARPRMVTAKVEYEFTAAQATLDIWRALPTTCLGLTPSAALLTAPFEVESYIAQWAAQDYERDDGSYSKVGDWLNSIFIGQNTINDDYPISIPGELAVTVIESVPNATTYAGWVTAKSELMAERTVQKWLGPIYMKRTVKVIAQ